MSYRKHCSLSVSEKVKLLEKLDEGMVVKNSCDKYSVSKSIVYDLKSSIHKFFKWLPIVMCQRLWQNEKLYNALMLKKY